MVMVMVMVIEGIMIVEQHAAAQPSSSTRRKDVRSDNLSRLGVAAESTRENEKETNIPPVRLPAPSIRMLHSVFQHFYPQGIRSTTVKHVVIV